MTTNIEKYIYTGDMFIKDFVNLKTELFEACKKKQINSEKRALRKYNKLTLMPEIDVAQVLFNYKNTAFILAFCTGIDESLHDEIYKKYNFVKTSSQYDGIWDELYFHDTSEAPARVGVYCEVYNNTPEAFMPEIRRSHNVKEFAYDDKGNTLIEGKDENEMINNIDRLISY